MGCCIRLNKNVNHFRLESPLDWAQLAVDEEEEQQRKLDREKRKRYHSNGVNKQLGL